MVSDSEASVPSSDDTKAVQTKRAIRSSQRKNNRRKVPKKIHKAEREKMKRDNLNVLFLKLSNTLEPTHQFSGKASILCNAIRLLNDLLTQVDNLKKENMALLSESRDINTEKNELSEENSALEVQIEELKGEVQQRSNSKSTWNFDHLRSQHDAASNSQEDHLVMPTVDHASQLPSVMGPLIVVPLHHHDLQAYHELDTLGTLSNLQSNVSRPLARYPSSMDSWPSQILPKQPEKSEIARHSSPLPAPVSKTN